jgi:cellulose synthase/poly-beta-1,6-N-acetylglucosamine synthase-like glycosyltransferase
LVTGFAIAIIAASSLALFAFGANILYLTYRATRLQPRRHPPIARGSEPRVCVQVPIYNERYVAERDIDAV